VSERLQKAVSSIIAAGFQLDTEAFNFLNALPQTEDILKLTEETIRKIRNTPEPPLFISRDFLEKVAKEILLEEKEPPLPPPSPPMVETKKAFHAYAKDIDADIKVIDDPTEKICATGAIEEYLEYFQDRFRKLRKILRQRMDTKDAMSISEALKAPVKSKVKTIGMITEKRESKQRIFLQVEDLDANITVLASPTTNPSLVEKAQMLLLDQVICVVGFKGNNDLLIAKDFILPDIPKKKPQRASMPVYATLISDLHVGSKKFMEEAFKRFLLWLNGKFGNEKMKRVASHVKYVVVAGDLVDGIGVYPRQIEELAIKDIYKQYQEAASFIEQIPDYVELLIIPGNHDASRKALPQPAISREYIEPLQEARKVLSFGNPCTITLHGVEFLLYHGRSLDDVIAVAPNMSFHTPDKAMKLLLRSRHLAPVYGERTLIAPELRDYLVIERVPDVFQTGHVHVQRHGVHRGVLIVNSGAWQEQTEYQKRMGLLPTPGVVPVVNLQTLQVTSLDFTSPFL
jgi:DNA polymerase II small subunit